MTVINDLGLHARAAAQLVRMARKFSSSITLTREDNGDSANAKSILSLLYIAASKGVAMTIRAEGTDEKEAIDAGVQLFGDGFGEL